LQAAMTPVLSETLAQWVQRYQSGLVYAIWAVL
jgi:sugar phosphate permease